VGGLGAAHEGEEGAGGGVQVEGVDFDAVVLGFADGVVDVGLAVGAFVTVMVG
jgi:hypothetical protein